MFRHTLLAWFRLCFHFCLLCEASNLVHHRPFSAPQGLLANPGNAQGTMFRDVIGKLVNTQCPKSHKRVETKEIQNREGLMEALDSTWTHSKNNAIERIHTTRILGNLRGRQTCGTDSTNREINVQLKSKFYLRCDPGRRNPKVGRKRKLGKSKFAACIYTRNFDKRTNARSRTGRAHEETHNVHHALYKLGLFGCFRQSWMGVVKNNHPTRGGNLTGFHSWCPVRGTLVPIEVICTHGLEFNLWNWVEKKYHENVNGAIMKAIVKPFSWKHTPKSFMLISVSKVQKHTQRHNNQKQTSKDGGWKRNTHLLPLMEMMMKNRAVMNDLRHQQPRPLLTQEPCTRCPCRLHARQRGKIQWEHVKLKSKWIENSEDCRMRDALVEEKNITWTKSGKENAERDAVLYDMLERATTDEKREEKDRDKHRDKIEKIH